MIPFARFCTVIWLCIAGFGNLAGHAQQRQEWNCKLISTKAIFSSLATGEVVVTDYDTSMPEAARLTITNVSEENEPVPAHLILMGIESEPDNVHMILGRGFTIHEDIVSAMGQSEGASDSIYLRRTYRTDWYGYWTTYRLFDDPDLGDLLAMATRVLECQALGVSVTP